MNQTGPTRFKKSDLACKFFNQNLLLFNSFHMSYFHIQNRNTNEMMKLWCAFAQIFSSEIAKRIK